MILSSTSPYALLKEFSIACGFKYDASQNSRLNICCIPAFTFFLNILFFIFPLHTKPGKSK